MKGRGSKEGSIDEDSTARNVLLIHPFSGHRTFVPPLGLLYVAAALRQAGFAVRVIEMDLSPVADEQLLAEISSLKPIYVGITCNIVQVSEVNRLATLIKPTGIPVVLGGPMPTVATNEMLSIDGVRICVRGEGEITACELADALAKGDDLASVAGISFIGADGTVVNSVDRPFIEDLDSVPFPAHDLNLPPAAYAANGVPAPESPLVAVLPSRGCPFDCSFCANIWRRQNRRRSPENILAELEWLVNQYGVKQVFFYDDTFNCKPDQVITLCQGIIDRGLKIGWRADCRANRGLLGPELLRLAKTSGCWLLAFGIESGNERIRKRINKQLHLDDILRARILCRDAGILFRPFFMIGNLGEGYAEVFDTLRLARQLDPDDPQFSIFTPVVGTRAYEEALANGWILDNNWDHHDLFHATVDTPLLSRQDTIVLRDLALLLTPQTYQTSLAGLRPVISDPAKALREKHGKLGESIWNLWQAYDRHGSRQDSPIVVLIPPSPPKVTVGRDTMGGLGQAFRGENVPVIPPVDAALLAGQIRSQGKAVFVLDSNACKLSEEQVGKFLASLQPSHIYLRTTVITESFDRAFAAVLRERIGVDVTLFGPAVGDTLLDEDLDQLPMPAWDLFPRYNLGAMTAGCDYLPIHASVGCPFGCYYCPYPIAQGRKHRMRAPRSVAAEMRHWRDTLGIRYFLFRDPVFSMNREHVLNLCADIREDGFQWRCETRADLLDEVLLRTMAAAGCRGLYIGIESTTEKVLGQVRRKPIDLDKVRDVVKISKQLGISCFVFYIVGLPGETRETFATMLDFARRLDTPFVQFSPIMAYPGTQLAEYVRKRGYVSGNLWDAPHYGTVPLVRNESLSEKDIAELVDHATRETANPSKRPAITPKGDVALGACHAYEQAAGAVRRAVEAIGGIGRYVRPGQRVLIKPNLIGAFPPEKAATTHPMVVEAVIRLVQEAGGIAVIGDSPGSGELAAYKDMSALHRVTGMKAVADRTGADLVDFSLAGTAEIPVNGRVLNSVLISREVLDTDVIISVPKLKTHAYTYYTGAVKNMYGVVPGLVKVDYHRAAPSLEQFSDLLIDIHDALGGKIKLVVMDGVVGMDGRGPTNGSPKPANFILAGVDSLIVDLVACKLVGLDPFKSQPLVAAVRRWQIHHLNLRLLGDPVKAANPSRFLPPLYESNDGFVASLDGIKPYINPSACRHCDACRVSCPMSAISSDHVIDRNICIGCMCCFEMCKNHAVELKQMVSERKAPEPASVPTVPIETAYPIPQIRAPKTIIHPERTDDHSSKPRRRILLISNLYPPYFIGGYEIAAEQVAEGLMRRGHKVHILTSTFGVGQPQRENGIARVLDLAYRVSPQQVFFDPPVSTSNASIVESEIEAFKPDLVYVWNLHGLSMGSAMEAIMGSGVPYVYHAMDYHFAQGNEMPDYLRTSDLPRTFLAQPRCRTIAMSETVRRRLVSSGHRHIHLVYHGVRSRRTQKFTPKSHNGLHLVFVGQVCHGKGISLLLQAIITSLRSVRDLTLDLYGPADGDYGTQVAAFVKKHALPVKLHGRIKHDEVLERLPAYDALVLPTLRPEPFGIVMIEAMQAGLPVVASRAGGPTEVIEHGKTGFLFEMGNADELARTLVTLARDRHLLRAMGEAARKVVQSKFDFERTLDGVEQVIEDVLRTPLAPAERMPSKVGGVTKCVTNNANPDRDKPVGIKWRAGIFDFSGYSQLCRQAILALDSAGVPQELEPFSADKQFIDQLAGDTHELARWQRLIQAKVGRGVSILFQPPCLWDGTNFFSRHRRAHPGHAAYVGITMFETDRLPRGWAEACNDMDEVWVPSLFNLHSFARAGVNPGKLQVVPFGVEVSAFDPAHVQPLNISGKRGFSFISVFQWNKRKGWDVLLKAYLSTFTSADDVSLVIRSYPDGTDKTAIRERVEICARRLGFSPRTMPSIIVLDEFIPEKQMPSLYAAGDAFVLPTRGEGWGVPFMEAMAMGLPVIATRWSAHLDFMNDDNSYLIDVDGLTHVDADQTRVNPFYTSDQLWAEPSVSHTAELMRRVFERRSEAREKGARARRYITEHWPIERTARWILGRVQELENRTRSTVPAPMPKASRGMAFTEDAATGPDLSMSMIGAHEMRSNREIGMPVVWAAPVYDPSGYADEARGFILGLQKHGVRVAVRPIGRHSPEFKKQLDLTTSQALEGSIVTETPSGSILVQHFPAYAFHRVAGAAYQVGRTMFETDGLPADWVACCNQIEEIWVPSDFNLDTFRTAGVTTQLVKIPGGIDAERFRPGLKPLSVNGARGMVFLSIFEWSYRKGWDVLLRAWAQAFNSKDDLSLVLRTYPINHTDGGTAVREIERQIDDFLMSLGCSRKSVAPIVVLGEQIPEADLPRLFAAAHAYVAPSRGEGWGRPQMQAMASGLPVIGTAWSGNTEFMKPDNSLLLDIDGLVSIDDREEIAFYRGQRWAEPSAAHLIELLRWVVTHPNKARDIGMRARASVVENWTWQRAAGIAAERLREIGKKLERPQTLNPISSVTVRSKEGAPPVAKPGNVNDRPLAIRWEGSQFVNHSFAIVNREICSRLIEAGHEVSVLPYESDEFGPGNDPKLLRIAKRTGASLSCRADVHVRLQWPPRFDPPPEGHWIINQPWEYGSLPVHWIEPMSILVDEIWAMSNFVKECYRRSGVPEELVKVVPCGVDCRRFHPDVPPIKLKTKKRFKFLFVGGTIWRKGADLLLTEYAHAFNATDDVCLVIKDMGGKSFYEGQTVERFIEPLRATPNAPEIEYINRMLTEDELPGLYTACDCLAHPYRGEGFGMTIAEAMACGLPVVVTNFGAALDFCSDRNAYLVPAQEKRGDKPVLGNIELVDVPWWGEPDVNALAALLRHVYEHPDEARQKGAAGRQVIQEGFTWDHAVSIVEARLREVTTRPIRRLTAPSTLSIHAVPRHAG